MAADRSRLAAALAYKQAEEERRRRMLESIPTPAGTTPAQPAPQTDFRTNLENLSIGVGEGLTNQLEDVVGDTACENISVAVVLHNRGITGGYTPRKFHNPGSPVVSSYYTFTKL